MVESRTRVRLSISADQNGGASAFLRTSSPSSRGGTEVSTSLAVENPASEETLAELRGPSEAQLEATIAGASEAFGGWAKAYETHFKDGATFDQIYVPGSKS